MIKEDDVFRLVQEFGPVVPTTLTSKTGENTIIIGAILSSLVAQKKLLVTNAKWGGSPLYYAPEQIEKIQIVEPHLNEKDRRAFQLLREKKVLKDADQTPLVRACLRVIKDFAFPITVKTSFGEELFWKWYLISNEEAAQLLRPMFAKPEQKPSPVAKAPVAVVQQAPAVVAESKPKPTLKPEVKKQATVPVSAPVQQPLAAADLDDGFYIHVKSKLAAKDVTIISAQLVKKNAELDLIILIPTNLGQVQYYAKVRNKKKSTDADLSQAYVKGQMLRLPTAYVAPGELSKKGLEMLKKDFASILFVKI